MLQVRVGLGVVQSHIGEYFKRRVYILNYFKLWKRLYRYLSCATLSNQLQDYAMYLQLTVALGMPNQISSLLLWSTKVQHTEKNLRKNSIRQEKEDQFSWINWHRWQQYTITERQKNGSSYD